MRKSVQISLLLFVFSCAGSARIRPGLEVGGCLAIRTYNENISVTLLENIGLLITPRTAVQVFGEQTYRNRAFVNSIAGGAEYRLGPRRFRVPLGVFGGMENMYIGNFSSTVAVFGLNSGILASLTDRLSLQVRYFSKWYMDTRTIWGNDVFVGFSFLVFGED